MNIDEMRKAEQNNYAREWRAKNKDKVSRANKRYWEKKVLAKLQSKSNEGKNYEN